MKVSIAQINYHVGNFESNKSKILSAIEKAENEKSDIIVFSELAICGYPPRDFLEFNDFIEQCTDAISDIATHCIKIAAVIGGPERNPSPKGKPLFNAAYFLNNGKIEKIVRKSLLPTYDIFDEYRYFEPNNSFETIEFKGEKIALTICEDLWNVKESNLYTVDPMGELSKQNPTLMINIAASPYHHNQIEERRNTLIKNVSKFNIPLVYVNHVGAQTELIFDGGSTVFNSKGEIIQKCGHFEEDIKHVDISENKILERSKFNKTEGIHRALILGIQDYFRKLGFKNALIGLSGGIDSAVTFALAAEALGSKNVSGILMPSQYSSDHSVDDAKQLAINLEAEYEVIEIEKAYAAYESLLAPQFKDLPFGLAEENLQARIRGVLLMAVSNKFGHIVLNTSNKSEAAVGYGTLYGDMCGGISVLGDVYKTEVFELARYINRDKEIIPENTITKPPSAELRPDQKDSDSLPEYDILDTILFEYIENRKGPKEIKAMGFDSALVDRVLKLVNINEYKRFQTPPILRVSSKAFGMGRRMPIVGKYLA